MAFIRILRRRKKILLSLLVTSLAFLYFTIRYFHGSSWECNNQRRGKYFETRQDYVIIYNYVQATKQFDCEEGVTFCTHADVHHLNRLADLTKRYDGPVSLSLYCPGGDFELALKSIAFLRNCAGKNIKELVTFHFVFDATYYPDVKKQLKPTQQLNDTFQAAFAPLLESYSDNFSCNSSPPHPQSKNPRNLSYPINTLRNAARDAALTHFSISVDLDLFPSRNFSKNFARMAQKLHGTILRNFKLSAYVLPAYEVEVSASIPENISILAKMLATEEANIFQHATCPQCHAVPKMSYKKWLSRSERTDLDVAFVLKRTLGWQPFFVGTKDDPGFDDRYTWGGNEDRLSQIYQMCLQDYNFLVLHNAFVVYKPENNADAYDNFLKNNPRNYRNQLEKDFRMIFGQNDNCYIVS